jgi:hypothetical protein
VYGSSAVRQTRVEERIVMKDREVRGENNDSEIPMKRQKEKENRQVTLLYPLTGGLEICSKTGKITEIEHVCSKSSDRDL